MATEVIKIVDPDNGSGTNYTSLSAWEAGEQGDLTGARDEIAVAKCRCTGGTADTTAVTISGWTADATRYIRVTADTGHEAAAKWDSSKYRLEITNPSATLITISVQNTRIEKLQVGIVNTSTHFIHLILLGDAASNCRVVGCFVRKIGTGNYCTGGIVKDDANYDMYVVNNICYSNATYSHVSNCGIRIGDATKFGNTIAYNNTVYGFAYGIMADVPPAVFKNNLCQNQSIQSYVLGSYPASGDYNLSGDSYSTEGSNDRTNKTVTFVDVSNYDFHLSSSDTEARGYGTNLYNDPVFPFQTDIDGDDRGGSGAQWDIGADECVVSLPPQLLTPQRSVQHMLVR